MRLQESSRRNRISLFAKAAAAVGLTLALLAPASAQFWGGWGDRGGWGRPQRPQQQQQQQFNPFGGWLENNPREIRPPREAPADYSRAPAPQRKPDSAATTPVVVLGDAMADWLAYGLEEAFSEKPEIAIVRKNRAAAGLIRYDTRREIEWPQVVREAIAADKPKFVVMMIGVNDRQAIRERVATTPPAATTRPGAARNATPSAATPTPAPASDPELQARESAEQQNAEMQSNAEPPANAPEAGRNAGSASNFEFHTEKWEAAYIKRIDATLAALKSANVPVFWVGLPAQRSNRAASDSAYLNELYRGRAEKAGVTYVDVWDGFVDDVGRFVVQGPDFEGQIRRLRAGDGIYFTKAGARKLAHYVEREILRSMTNRAMPVALPAPEPAPVAPGARPPSGPAPRPLAGPVVPLTSLSGGNDELLGGGPTRAAPSPQRPAPVDPAASRVLTRGEPLAGPSGRADDFGWPRGNPARPAAAATSPAAPTQATGSRPAAVSPPAAAAVEPPPVTAQPITAAAPPEPAAEPPPETKPVVKRKPPAPRPVVRRDVRPEPFSPFASSPGWWR